MFCLLGLSYSREPSVNLSLRGVELAFLTKYDIKHLKVGASAEDKVLASIR